MLTIITTCETRSYEDIAEYNKHLLDEGEGVKIKTFYGQRIYYKVNNTMQLKLK